LFSGAALMALEGIGRAWQRFGNSPAALESSSCMALDNRGL
jgi:hypothetical protein